MNWWEKKIDLKTMPHWVQIVGKLLATIGPLLLIALIAYYLLIRAGKLEPSLAILLAPFLSYITAVVLYVLYLLNVTASKD